MKAVVSNKRKWIKLIISALSIVVIASCSACSSCYNNTEYSTSVETKNNNTTETIAELEEQTIEEAAEEYVRKFIMIQESGNQYDPKAEDFASIHGYIAAKYYKWRQDNNNHYSQSGIHDISVISCETGRIIYYEDCCEVPVNVYYRYMYDGEIESAVSETFRVFFDYRQERKAITDIYMTDCYEVNDIEDGILLESITDKAAQVEYVDAIFENYYRQMH